MRRLVYILLVLAVAGGLLYYYRHQVFPALPEPVRATLPDPAVTTAYKWRDASGTWQLTDTPPPPGVPYETVRVRRDTNVIPAEALTGRRD